MAADLHGGGGLDLGPEFEEEEVWAMMKSREGAASNYSSTSKIRKNFSTNSSSSSASAWAIPRSGGGGPPRKSSAPVSIPDWSKILKKPKKKWDDEDDEEACDDDDDEAILPPHEYLARRLASSQIASFSMCEGVGRTLKGRDLSNLRNAILTKTGFLE